MARLGLGEQWRCLVANDVCPKKAASYRANFAPAEELLLKDVWEVTTEALPGCADLAWASFPCQDLSLAGNGAGLSGERSGTFWGFWKLILGLAQKGRLPRMVLLENVCGALTSHGGRDFEAIAEALIEQNYQFGALVINAALFLPQSRPRLFIVATQPGLQAVGGVTLSGPSEPWHTKGIVRAHSRLPARLRENWVWWDLPRPPVREGALLDVIEQEPVGVVWDSDSKTKKILGMMSEINLAKVNAHLEAGGVQVGALYRRTRPDSTGRRTQRAEVRFDGLSGCLRTPQGGSSRQTLLFADGKTGRVRSRLLSPREAARLMGVSDSYVLPDNYNEAYHLMGDGLAVPVVAWLEKYLLRPLCLYQSTSKEAA